MHESVVRKIVPGGDEWPTVLSAAQKLSADRENANDLWKNA